MRYNRKEYEDKIRNSSLFELDRNKQYNEYKKEALKMVENLYCYLCAINEFKYADYGYNITILANRCINSFDVSKGVFLNYFCAAWKLEWKKIEQEKVEEQKYCGLNISDEDKRNVRKYIKLAKSKGIEVKSSHVIENLSVAMNLSKQEVKEIIRIAELKVNSNIVQNNDEEEFDLFDLVDSQKSTEDSIVDSESVFDVFEKIEAAYNTLQERQKKIVSEIITSKICELIDDVGVSIDHFDFINRDVVESYLKTRKIPTQREIADKYKKNEASISRTTKEFIKKLKSEVECYGK